MRVSVYVPDALRPATDETVDKTTSDTRDGAKTDACIPVIYWLSGLTCTEENFTVKAGAQRMASQLGVALIAPDTSPRGVRFDGDAEAYDFGVGAGFYLDATQEPWRTNYRMYSYVTDELPGVVATAFPSLDIARASIMGHSMGGHGALTIALKNPQRYRSVSAFAPIVAPMDVPWGQKAFTGYLGSDKAAWANYDACALVQSRGWNGPAILVDQGSKDSFLEKQLQPQRFAKACEAAGVNLQLRMQDGFDHSYFFIATFIEDHLRFHADVLNSSEVR